MFSVNIGNRIDGIEIAIANTLNGLFDFKTVNKLSDVSDGKAREYRVVNASRDITDRQMQLPYDKFFNEVVLSSLHEIANQLNDAFKERLWMSIPHVEVDQHSKVFSVNGIIGIVLVEQNAMYKKQIFRIQSMVVRP